VNKLALDIGMGRVLAGITFGATSSGELDGRSRDHGLPAGESGCYNEPISSDSLRRLDRRTVTVSG